METGMTGLVERISALSRQENEIYALRHDYLSSDYQTALRQKTSTAQSLGNGASSSNDADPSSSVDSKDFTAASSKSTGISEVWREKICEWIFAVIDHFDYNREIASISLNYLDRYSSTCMVDKKMFQLAALTSLFLAVKLYEPTTLKISVFVELSRGNFKIEHIVSMERSILWALSWHVHPPIPFDFVKHYILITEESGCTPMVALEVNNVAKFLTEISVCDYYFTTCKPSSTALGAVLTAFEMFNDATLPTHIRQTFLEHVCLIGIIDASLDEVLKCKGRLSATFHQDRGYQQQIIEALNDTGHLSPNCVTNMQSSCNLTKTL